MWRATGDIAEQGTAAYTYFYVRQTHAMNSVMPADAVVDKRMAELIVDAIVYEGEKLQKTLVHLGIVKGEPYSDNWHVDLQQLTYYFWDHCVVMTGHLPTHYWPKFKRYSRSPVACTLCTCQCFGQHIECERDLVAQTEYFNVFAMCAFW